MARRHTLVAMPSGRAGKVDHGVTLRSALRSLGVGIESLCAENATCGKCKIVIEEGYFEANRVTSSPAAVSEAGPEERAYLAPRNALFANSGWRPDRVRLACQARLLGDLVLTVPDESRSDRTFVRKAATARTIEVSPSLRKYLVELSPPSLSHPQADWPRLASGLATCIGLVRSGEDGLPKAQDFTIDRSVLQELPEMLRGSNWRVTTTVREDREVVRVEAGFRDRLVGAAIDVGTTTLALYVCDLASGEVLATASDLNPQIEFGADVMSRIQYCVARPEGLKTLHKAVVRAANQLLTRACAEAGVAPADLMELVMVGNTTMQHLFFELTPTNLGVSPFVPVTSAPLDVRARDLRLLLNPSANVHTLPSIASFIGADTTAVLLAEAPHEQDEIWLIIDIGTNAELVLGNRRQLLCASTPTGPALEGAHIEYGMRAAPGAIEHVCIDDQQMPSWRLVGEERWRTGHPKGLCGSAVVDAIAELVRVKIIDESGRLRPERDSQGRARVGPGGPEYVIAAAGEIGVQHEICLTQKDVRQVQLAKAALFVAARSLLDRLGLDVPDKVLLAGAFGTYMDKEKAMAIGMLPRVPLDRVFIVGNAAGDGARIALLNREKRQEAVKLARRIVRHELPADPEFQGRFLAALAFPAP